MKQPTLNTAMYIAKLNTSASSWKANGLRTALRSYSISTNIVQSITSWNSLLKPRPVKYQILSINATNSDTVAITRILPTRMERLEISFCVSIPKFSLNAFKPDTKRKIVVVNSRPEMEPIDVMPYFAENTARQIAIARYAHTNTR